MVAQSAQEERKKRRENAHDDEEKRNRRKIKKRKRVGKKDVKERYGLGLSLLPWRSRWSYKP